MASQKDLLSALGLPTLDDESAHGDTWPPKPRNRTVGLLLGAPTFVHAIALALSNAGPIPTLSETP